MPLRRLVKSLSIWQFWRFLCHINLATVREVVVCTFEQRLPSLSSEMAYYAILGLFPGILASLTAISLVDSLQNTFNKMAIRLGELAPEQVNSLIEEFVKVINSNNPQLFSISFLVALWASSGAISAAMRALDHIHQIPDKQARPFWKAKLVSLGLTLGAILLLVMASYLIFVSDLVIRNVASQSGEAVETWVLYAWRSSSWPLALGIVSAAFAFIYRFGPSRWTPGKPLLQGAVLAALSWAIISVSFRFYVSHNFSAYNRIYGAIGAVIVLLLWLYLTSLVMLIGDLLNVIVGKAMAKSQYEQSEIASLKPFLRRLGKGREAGEAGEAGRR